MLLIGGAAGATELSGADICRSPEARAWAEDLKRRGVWRAGELLRPSDESRTVRVRDQKTLQSDGPFAETKEHVGGFALLECASLDEAVAIASAHPSSRLGMVEVRPVWDG
jgi:hypothetical protein